MAHHEAALVGSQDVDAQLATEVVGGTEKYATGEQIEALVQEEHTLTFRDVCRQYPKIVWWSFFWCMSAVACKSLASHMAYQRLTNSSGGFEMSVNNAIIGVPAFRTYFGRVLDHFFSRL